MIEKFWDFIGRPIVIECVRSTADVGYSRYLVLMEGLQQRNLNKCCIHYSKCCLCYWLVIWKFGNVTFAWLSYESRNTYTLNNIDTEFKCQLTSRNPTFIWVSQFEVYWLLLRIAFIFTDYRVLWIFVTDSMNNRKWYNQKENGFSEILYTLLAEDRRIKMLIGNDWMI